MMTTIYYAEEKKCQDVDAALQQRRRERQNEKEVSRKKSHRAVLFGS